MKATELRIGNLALTPRKLIVAIDTITENGFLAVNKNSCRWYSKLNPIPITEEWLLKFSVNGYNISLNDNKYGAIDFSDINDLYLVNDEHENFPLTKIKYVHQLQNIYFALTGSELEIK